jgi:hypothetical protein
MYARCVSCHNEKGTAFSLMTYQDAQPRADAIKDATLSRRMPPWGAVKGFGDFRDDQSLSQEEVGLIADWVEGGIQRGNNASLLPKEPKIEKIPSFKMPKDGVTISGETTLHRALTIDGLIPERTPRGVPMQIVAVRPDGGVEPLVWLYEYRDDYRHPFLFRKSIELPAGTVIRGVTPESKIVLIPGKKK